MKRLVSIDGRVSSPEEAKVSVYDRGFLYGDSVFEALRTYRGRPFALDQHLRRLARSAEQVFIPVPISEDAFSEEITRTLDLAGDGEKYARIMLTRGSGPLGLDPDLAGAPLRVVLVEPLVPPKPQAYAQGIGLITTHVQRSVDGTVASGAKVSNYLSSLLATREAKAKGAAEALVIDARGEVIEGASSNVFIVRNGRLITPPEDAGILVGITRGHILGCARRLGLAVDLARITGAELREATEVFITSSIRELLPAVTLDGRTVGDGRPGPVARELHRAFREEVGMGQLPMPWEDG